MSDDPRAKLLQAALPHVPFDGWSEATFQAAIADSGVSPGVARATCPRGAVNLALAYHESGDYRMIAALEAADLDALRFRDRIALAVRLRLEAVEDKELVRRGVTLFALPQYAADGARSVWGTCDRIWRALGDRSKDINWYTKRATLSGVYSATVLYWLGDDSPGHAATWEFLDRRIDDVMRIETMKAKARDNKVLSTLMAGPMALVSRVRAPGSDDGASAGMPGQWRRET